jgi:hypothetical protein
LPEIVQEIGAAAGLAAVAGLAVLSVLYFSQARDVKRLREWAGRAPERAETAAPQVVPGRVQAQPQPKPAQAAAATGAAAATAGATAAGQPQPAEGQPGQPQPVPAAASSKTADKPGTGEDQPSDGTPTPGQAPADAPADAPKGAPAGGDGDGGKPEPGQPPQQAPRTGAPVMPATAGARAAAATEAKPAQATPGQASPAQPGAAKSSAPTGPGGPATPAGGRPSGAPPVPAAASGQRAPVRPMLPPRPMPQQTAIIPPPRQPWYRRVGGSPRYLVLLVAGILILGGAGAFGIDQLSKDDSGGGTPSGDGGTPAAGGGDNDTPAKKQAGVVPANVTVAVLNGTTVPNLAKQVGERVEAQGFELGTVANGADQEQQRADSVVLFAPGHEREARAVSRRLSINQRQPIDPASQQLAGDATVVVIAGGDLAQ